MLNTPDFAQLVDLLAQTLEIPLDPEHRPGVVANFTRTAEIAQLIMEFPLPNPDQIEVAFTFEP